MIYAAHRRYQWPGTAAVTASVVHLSRTSNGIGALLDDKPVPRISSFLLVGSVDEMPVVLHHNRGRCYRGTKIWGAGFVFESNPSNGSSSLGERASLIAADPANAKVIVPYIGGQEFTESPSLSARRYVIEFGDRSKEEARVWADLFRIVEERNYRDEWWRHANRAAEAAPYASTHGRLLAATAVSKHLSFGFIPAGTIIADSMTLVLHHTNAAFALVQSRPHETWARFIGSSLEDRLRYTTPCFDSRSRSSGKQTPR